MIARLARGWAPLGIAIVGASLPLLGLWMGVQRWGETLRTAQPHSTQVVGELIASAAAGQTVRAEWDGLAGVAIRMATYGRRNTGPLIFHLRTSPDDPADLVRIQVDASQIPDNAYYWFRFPPLSRSAGRSFYFYLEAPQARPGNAVTVWGSTEDRYPDGQAVLRGLPGSGVRDLTFELAYDPPLPVRLALLLDRLAVAKPMAWGDPRFYIGLFLIQIALTFLALFTLARP